MGILSVLCSGCNSVTYHLYNSDKSNGLNFTTGKWLIGDIEVNKNVKTKLTALAIKDFTALLNERVKYAPTEKALLIPLQNPLNPNKYQIDLLKKSTGYDYFINIKCKNGRNDMTNYDYTENTYLLEQMNAAVVTLEVYDLNRGTIVYTQTAVGKLHEDASFTARPTYTVLMGSYNRILNDIRKKSILQ
ncbi:MAG: hypothetical protein PSV16_13865 [Flavobacterium sp.]|nr:hypothetical protein [Flavobacterium sp.]